MSQIFQNQHFMLVLIVMVAVIGAMVGVIFIIARQSAKIEELEHNQNTLFNQLKNKL